VPRDGAPRSSCLRQLGRIYAAAAQVAVVLSSECGEVLGQIHHAVDEAGLRIFEPDEWVTRVWTYHEVVNSKQLWSVAQERNKSQLRARSP
jgi:hypothetical protein